MDFGELKTKVIDLKPLHFKKYGPYMSENRSTTLLKNVFIVSLFDVQHIV